MSIKTWSSWFNSQYYFTAANSSLLSRNLSDTAVIYPEWKQYTKFVCTVEKTENYVEDSYTSEYSFCQQRKTFSILKQREPYVLTFAILCNGQSQTLFMDSTETSIEIINCNRCVIAGFSMKIDCSTQHRMFRIEEHLIIRTFLFINMKWISSKWNRFRGIDEILRHVHILVCYGRFISRRNGLRCDEYKKTYWRDCTACIDNMYILFIIRIFIIGEAGT